MAKRTYEQSLTFFQRQTDKRGEGRELYKTPRTVIRAIVQSLLSDFPQLYTQIWVDSCAGDGRWGEEIHKICPSIEYLSMDIKPLNDKVIKQDFFELTIDKLKDLCIQKGYNVNNFQYKVFFIGNPPFSLIKEFMLHTLNLGFTGFYLGGSAKLTGTLCKYAEQIYRFSGAEGKQKDLRSKILFEDTQGKNVPIWCCGSLFNHNINGDLPRTTYQLDGFFRVSVNLWCKDEKFANRVKEIIL